MAATITPSATPYAEIVIRTGLREQDGLAALAYDCRHEHGPGPICQGGLFYA
jgi:hypothetical protein